MNASQAVYDESKIKSLSSLEHIRLRPGMYIGRLGDGSHPDDGVYVLIKEVVDNAIDEFIMGHGKKIEIATQEDGTVSVRDYGRGIPLGKIVECVSRINTGAKYNDDVFQFSVGLNGVGTKAVNALSERFMVRSVREGEFRQASFRNGILEEEHGGESKEKNGTYVEFLLDRSIFPDKVKLKPEYLRRRIDFYAYLNAGLTLILDGEKIVSKNGLRDLLQEEVGAEDMMYEPLHYRDATLEFSMAHTNNYGESFFSFVNGQYTNDGGTHLSCFREGILRGINDYSGKNFKGEDVREGIVGAIAIKLKDPVFESQTKNKLGNSDIKGWVTGVVKDAVADMLHKNPEIARIVMEKVSLNEKIRKELQAVKKEARDKARKIAIKIPNLRDCKYHRGDSNAKGGLSVIFLTEGQSALGSMVSSRDAETQALFSLRGKPLNVFGMKRDAVYRNAELYNVMKALGIEDSIDYLRYEKVILATDADVDGLHIRNLLITFFLHFFEELVTSGHLYILETPIFRVRNKKETHYCYSEDEKDKAVKRIKEPEITRFKGLGEISPNEFGQFIGKDIRLVQVNVDHLKEVKPVLTFYMGNNTPDRKSYIMENLV
ncbi:MAG: type IIA DNA topoisomerase subunit B [Acidobacteria bacterium]|nr:type IIA DNA topoisomerase subunit B [Acidobacteriota bacterium]MCB9396874.1 type IIA DNA topoisomerase subunit B [Acidobacteriota bacterium]